MKLPLLISFAHHSPEKIIDLIKKNEFDIFLDSGAYTNFTTGQKEGKGIKDYIFFFNRK